MAVMERRARVRVARAIRDTMAAEARAKAAEAKALASELAASEARRDARQARTILDRSIVVEVLARPDHMRGMDAVEITAILRGPRDLACSRVGRLETSQAVGIGYLAKEVCTEVLRAGLAEACDALTPRLLRDAGVMHARHVFHR